MGGLLSSKRARWLDQSLGTTRCVEVGKCFCPSRAPQRGRNHKGLGTPLPFVQRLIQLARVARATGAARRVC
jgi:hypothetical protein